MPQRVPTFRAAVPAAASRHKEYDQAQRDRDAKRFYNSSAWVKLRRMHLRASPLCVQCQAQGRDTPATHVHHIAEVLDDADARLDESNLRSLCHSHHSALHASQKTGGV